ncbi:hypothetical protein BDU57DRAFT_510266 [Ampelomyces quisqualis]|uniref:AAA+ ATPase domain-containing protein n=1 Tax=Ampelomyces quisqualis TaxID=50730 RepID=A0A6A5R3S2_AMPQU|nr:hypothetical protein BDU57DRAFT_510266 [Ampelomyces quisqualis]
MALAAVHAAMKHEATQSLHPFFSKPSRTHAPLEDISTNETRSNDPNDNDDSNVPHAPAHAEPPPKKKRARKTEGVKEKRDGGLATKNQASLHHFARAIRVPHADLAVIGHAEDTPAQEDSNSERKKRRKTASPPPTDASTNTVPTLDWHQQLQVEALRPHLDITTVPVLEEIEEDPSSLLQSTALALAMGSPDPGVSQAASTSENNGVIVTPQKQIKVTKSGKLVSSPLKPTVEESSPPRKRRGRKPAKMKICPTITVIRYGIDAANRQALGDKIEAILSKKFNSQRSTITKNGPSKPPEPPKVTHPFFSGKPVAKVEEVASKSAPEARPPSPKKSAVTPGKLRAEARRERSPGPAPSFGTSVGSSRVTKQSGLQEASWPTRENAHVRNFDSSPTHTTNVELTRCLPHRSRKLKNRVPTLADEEEIISRLATDLAGVMRFRGKEAELDFSPPEDVRLPTRLLTTGVDIQNRVYERLQTRFPWPSEKPQRCRTTHPAVTSLFGEIEHTLTPFDEGRCEGRAWTQKYSPKCASHVLHEGKDALVLKDWLQSLTVMAVGGAQVAAKADTADTRRPPKKKRKKATDDFIISDDDEEDEEMVDLSDTEDVQTRSVRRPRWTRNNNVVLISGPHGCGKSAAIYAVAKELDFEVFEINSGTRRSGKDIQDRVGDMTANHLVNHRRPEAQLKDDASLLNDDEEEERMDTALQKDIDSGRQGTVMTFFKAKPAIIAKPKVAAKAREPKTVPKSTAQTMLPKLNTPQKSQKQSLILFEEADILFEEDQQFWAQVTKLAVHSKRPIIITCNDERQIPLPDLPLAAVLRMHASPVELATDYMLILAGREGHILEREAIRDLYISKNQDLRSSITELDLWCQMSVGDRKGGLEWLYQRWPPGKDVDAHGRLLRVASQGTYQAGMGWLSHNVFECENNAVFDKEEALLNEGWAEWGINPAEWSLKSSTCLESTHSDTLKCLERLDRFAETLSAADVYCRVGLPSYNGEYDEPADPTLPPIFNKSRLSYSLDAPLLQADLKADFLQFDTTIYAQTHLLAHRAFPECSNFSSTYPDHGPTTETDYTKELLRLREAKSKEDKLSRPDFSHAFDVLAAPADQMLPERTSFMLTPSSFDRTFSVTTLDLAPYVRSIVAHEQILEASRIRMSSLLSSGGNGKRARTTRASRVALEGGVRETKRRDRWFDAELNFELVMATAGKEWAGMGWRSEAEDGDGPSSVTGIQESLRGSQDVTMQGSQGQDQETVITVPST